MRFADPAFLVLLAIPIAHAFQRWRHRRRAPAQRIALPALDFIADLPLAGRARWRPILSVLRTLGLALLALALARPQMARDVREIRLRSRNIMLALDISSSMKAGDFHPGNRLTVARRVVGDFVQRREGDLVGLVLFAGRAFLQAPLTPDLALLRGTLGRVDIGLLPDGTAIGTALALSLNQLKDLPVKASTIVLITDGANNTGRPTPLVAAEAARTLGIRIQAIGLSTADTASVPLNGVWRVGNTAPRLTNRDEAALQRMAERTGGRYYRANDPESLNRVMDQIDQAERIDVRVGETREYRELYPYFLAPALLLLALELVFGATWLRTLP
ncbi:MAG TPA: VWA domain-containing protein [Gemmatimonadales bacterium]|jgi:Ca-activated chloride channel family protein|nr:VWA domain-containing protein [Gemmatimonadales bacterium]